MPGEDVRAAVRPEEQGPVGLGAGALHARGAGGHAQRGKPQRPGPFRKKPADVRRGNMGNVPGGVALAVGEPLAVTPADE